MNTKKKILSNNLKFHRGRRKLSQIELGKKAFDDRDAISSRNLISKIETGAYKRSVPREEIEKIAIALHVSVDELTQDKATSDNFEKYIGNFENFREVFAHNVKLLREYQGISQQDLGLKAFKDKSPGAARGYVGRIENKAYISPLPQSDIDKIALALERPVNDLIFNKMSSDSNGEPCFDPNTKNEYKPDLVYTKIPDDLSTAFPELTGLLDTWRIADRISDDKQRNDVEKAIINGIIDTITKSEKLYSMPGMKERIKYFLQKSEGNNSENTA